ncbi:MAG: DUF805 domain-containing protein [Bacteroidales bacterium]
MERFYRVWKRTFDFQGYSNRREFWWFVLYQAFIITVLKLLDGYSFFMYFQVFYLFFSILPMISVSIRRLRDAGRSPVNIFYIFVPVIGWLFLLFYLLQKKIEQ